MFSAGTPKTAGATPALPNDSPACIHWSEPEFSALKFMLFLKWFASRTVRHAWQAANHVEKIVHHQQDLLSPEAIRAVNADLADLRSTCRAGDKGAIRVSLAKLEKSANKH